MGHPEGAGCERGDRVDFDRRVRLEFRGTQLGSDGGLLVVRALDDALELSDLASGALCDSRRGQNPTHRLDGQFRQSVYGRLAGCDDVNDADRLALDPVMQTVPRQRGAAPTACAGLQSGDLASRCTELPEARADRSLTSR